LDIRDLKKAIKAKSDELSEMQIRKDKAEKRLTDATRDADLVIIKLSLQFYSIMCDVFS
jgi:hypothetical protein